AVLKNEPDWTDVPTSTPPAVRRVLTRCLTKARTERLHAIADARIDLGSANADAFEVPPRVASSRRHWLLGVAGLMALMLGLYAYAGRLAQPHALGASYVYDLPLPPGTKHWAGLALSPDGRRLAIVTQPVTTPAVPDPRLWIRELDSAEDWQLVSG